MKIMSAQKGEFRSTDPKALKERWQAYLTTHNLNVTTQREAIVDQFLRTQDHISIDELLARVRKRH
jgi:Fe2+ or Zn2+ uptake regulation protein